MLQQRGQAARSGEFAGQNIDAAFARNRALNKGAILMSSTTLRTTRDNGDIDNDNDHKMLSVMGQSRRE